MDPLLIFLRVNRNRLFMLIKPCATLVLVVFICSSLISPAGAAVQASGADGRCEQAPLASPALRSGSSIPAIMDCLLQRPGESEQGPGPRGDVHISYPALGYKPVDDDIRAWVSDMADAFLNHLSTLDARQAGTDDLDTVIEALLNDEGPAPEGGVFELWGAYRISRPSNAAVSIVFELWNHTGDQEGNLDIITLNYSLITGQRLELVDIFEKPDVALELMSAWARKQLKERTGVGLRTKMMMEGTEPVIENFSSLTLTPEGICINFQPWQVAPQYAGLQTVVMPLKELLPSAPLLALWGKGEKHDERAD